MRIYHTPNGRNKPAGPYSACAARHGRDMLIASAALEFSYIKLTPEEMEVQKRFGFTSDDIKVRATVATTFTDHGARRRAE